MFKPIKRIQREIQVVRKFDIYWESWFSTLRQIREQSGFSQEFFAQLMGIGKHSQAAYEKGLAQPSIQYWEKIVKFYELDLEWILFGGRYSVNRGPRKEVEGDPLTVTMPEEQSIQPKLSRGRGRPGKEESRSQLASNLIG